MSTTSAKAGGPTPAGLGYSMPAEWEGHEATWLAWPHNPTDWPGKIEPIHWVYGEIARKIAPGERVRILVNSKAHQARARDVLTRAGVSLGRVEFFQFPTNRGWTRDCGPIFVRRKTLGGGGAGGARTDRPGGQSYTTAIVRFRFNAWARYPDWRKDDLIPERAAGALRMRLFPALVGAGLSGPAHSGRAQAGGTLASAAGRRKAAPALLVLEGGSIDVNGRGTLLTTEECLLDQKTQARNPGMSRAQVEGALREYLGVTNVQWLGRGIAGDDTHGHVDDLCRFVNRRTVALVREKNPRDVNYRPLEDNWERIGGLRLEDGSRLEAVPLPMPAPLYFEGQRLPASYANFYISNAAVIVPTFNDPADRVALGTLAELFRPRPVVGIHAVDLVWGLGTLHCLTQQQPAA